MDNGLIFPYRSVRVPADTGVLRKALRGLPNPPAVGQRWGDVEG
jgi:hypothetical protein